MLTNIKNIFEKKLQMNEYVVMKKIIVALAIITTFFSTLKSPVFSLDVVEPQQSAPAVTAEEGITRQQEEEMFAPVELDLTDYSYMNKENKKFKLSAEKEGKPSYAQSTGQIWQEDMLFRYNYYSNESNLRVLPSYGSLGSYVTKQLDENTSVMVGQDGISEINGDTVNFSYEHYSYYSSGARLDGNCDKFNYSVGAFNETDTLNQELGAIVSTKPTSILNSKGKFYVGGGAFTTLMNGVDLNTTGVFAQYKNNKLSLGAQISNSSYSKSGYEGYSKAHFLTKYKVNDHLSLKNKIVQNFDVGEVQGELGVVVNPLKDTDRLQLEVTAANYQSQNVITRQRLKFTTSFKF